MVSRLLPKVMLSSASTSRIPLSMQWRKDRRDFGRCRELNRFYDPTLAFENATLNACPLSLT
jgi:hypothetical protein